MTSLLRVYPRVVTCLQVKHTRPDPLLLTLACLSLAVKVPNRLRQQLRDVGMFLLQYVPDLMAAHQVTLTTLQRLSDAQQANKIRVVGVEELSRICTVDAYLVNLRRILAEILDMTEDMAARVLTDKVAQVCSEAHVCNGRFLVPPFSNGQALEQDKTLAINKLLAQRLEELAEFGELELLFRDTRQRYAGRDEGICRVGDFGDLRFREDVRPALWVVGVF